MSIPGGKMLNVALRSQKGFTLIEMSIVLVIIGLIIGGILKGQEVIESSRSKNVLSEVERIRAATNTFFDRYKALPGDFSLAAGAAGVGRITTDTTNVSNGNGDGVVGPVAAANTEEGIIDVDAGTSGNENVAFFAQMAAAKLIGGVTPGLASTTFGEGGGSPAAAFPGTGYTLAYGNYADDASTALQAHWLRLHKGTPTATAAGLMPKQIQAIDVRIDDGIPASGAVRSAQQGANAGECGALTSGTAVDYQPTVESVSCIALFALVQ